MLEVPVQNHRVPSQKSQSLAGVGSGDQITCSDGSPAFGCMSGTCSLPVGQHLCPPRCVPPPSLRATASVQELMAVPRALAAAHSYSPASFLETLAMVSICRPSLQETTFSALSGCRDLLSAGRGAEERGVTVSPPPPGTHPPRQRRQPPTFHPEDPGGRAASGQAAEGQRLPLQQHLVLQLDVENGGKIWKAEGGEGGGGIRLEQ